MEETLGIYSLIPIAVTLTCAFTTKRVVESLLLGILSGVLLIDANLNGLLHSIGFSINNLFGTIVGTPANPAEGISGIGLMKSSGRPQIVFVVLLLGAFINILEKSGGAMAFGELLTRKIKDPKQAKTSAAIMGCSLFTSAYFSSLGTGMVFKPIFERLKISRAKLAFIIDATSAPINTLIPISGWVAYMSQLIVDNIPEVTDGVVGLVRTMPYNFYSWFILVFVFLNCREIIKDFGPMKVAEDEVEHEIEGEKAEVEKDFKDGTASDMVLPLGISVVILIVLGLWNYTLTNFGVQRIPLSGNDMLILSFSVGLMIALIKYKSKKLMETTEFFDLAISGAKSTLTGAMIIVLAVTLGDILRTASPTGVGAAQFLQGIAQEFIPVSIIPLAAFVLSAGMSFCMGTSWGVWAIMIPITVPMAIATGGNPILVAAAVLSGGTFGDHCSPISDTSIMSSLGSGCVHMKHINTQMYYAVSVAAVAALAFLIAGFIC